VFSGFGKFSVSDRAAREGRNPATGEKIYIKATKVPKFSAGASLKKAGQLAAERYRFACDRGRGALRMTAGNGSSETVTRDGASAIPVPAASFGDRLAESVARRESQLVLGLDPDPALLWPHALELVGGWTMCPPHPPSEPRVRLRRIARW